MTSIKYISWSSYRLPRSRRRLLYSWQRVILGPIGVSRLSGLGIGFEPGPHTLTRKVKIKHRICCTTKAVSVPRRAAPNRQSQKQCSRDRGKKKKAFRGPSSLLRRRRRRPVPHARYLSLGPRLCHALHDRLASQPAHVDVHEHDVPHCAGGQRRILARRSAILVRNGGGDRRAACLGEPHGRRPQRGEDDRRGERDARGRS